MDANQLYESLKKIREPKGYYFNADKEKVMYLLESLLANKERYGYMACPCRLASGDSQKDKDIVCPCVYCPEDVKEFGACYCALYVSDDYNRGSVEKKYVPERRPVHLMF